MERAARSAGPSPAPVTAAAPDADAVLATHRMRLQDSGAQPSAADLHADGLPGDLVTDDILGACMPAEPLRPNGAAALTQHEIEGFLSDRPLPAEDACGDGHVNDEFIFDLIARLEAGNDAAAPPAGVPVVASGVPDLSHAELDEMLRDEFLEEEGGEGVTADDLMEFSRSIADDTIDDLVDDDDDVCSAPAPRGDEASSAPPPVNGEGRGGGGASTSGSAARARRSRGRARAVGAKRTRRKALPAALVSMIEAGGESASRVRAALVRSQRARKQNVQRAKRVKQSFLAGAERAADGDDAPGDATQSSAKQGSKPEVVRRAPLTMGERLASLHQGVLEARKEWHERVNLLQMLLQSQAKRKGADAPVRPNDDVRLRAQRRGVEQATQAVLAASGALLLARAELRVSKLPEEAVYSCDVEGKMQARLRCS